MRFLRRCVAMEMGWREGGDGEREREREKERVLNKSCVFYSCVYIFSRTKKVKRNGIFRKEE